MSTFLRLLPYNPRMGALVGRYTYRSMTFVGGRRPHWYEIKDRRLLDELVALKQDQYDPRSLPLFEVMSETDKLATEQRETNQFLAAMGAVKDTLSIAPALQHPPTHEVAADKKPGGPITTEAIRRDGAVVGGRAAALPPIRDDQLADASEPPPPVEAKPYVPGGEEPNAAAGNPDPTGDDSDED